jgi:hypothetical protein
MNTSEDTRVAWDKIALAQLSQLEWLSGDFRGGAGQKDESDQ